MEQDDNYLAKLQDYYADNSVLPPYSTIMSLLGFKSKSAVAALVARLKLAQFLESTPENALSRADDFLNALSLTVCVQVPRIPLGTCGTTR